MGRRAYEVVEKAAAYRTYIVFADSAEQAKRLVKAGENQPHPHNTHEDGYTPRIISSRRAPAYDREADVGTTYPNGSGQLGSEPTDSG